MKTVKQACAPQAATFDPVRRDAVLDLSDLVALDAGHWREDAAAARVLAGAVENDHV